MPDTQNYDALIFNPVANDVRPDDNPLAPYTTGGPAAFREICKAFRLCDEARGKPCGSRRIKLPDVSADAAKIVDGDQIIRCASGAAIHRGCPKTAANGARPRAR